MDLKEIIKSYFIENKPDKRLEGVKIFVCRADGIPLYSTHKQEEDQIGALVAGVWQAAEVMYQRFDDKKSVDEFRFNFDTTDSGVGIFPMVTEQERYFFTIIFEKTVNPALVKSLARSYANSLTDHVASSYKCNRGKSASKAVFSDLSDNEIDRAFAFAENN